MPEQLQKPHQIKIYVNIDGQWVSLPEAQSSSSDRRMERALVEISAKLDRIVHNQQDSKEREKQIMNELAALKTKVDTANEKITNLNTALDGYRESVRLLKEQLATLQTQIADLQSGATLPEPVLEKVLEISDGVDAAIAAVDNTLAENFPTVEPPPVVPEV